MKNWPQKLLNPFALMGVCLLVGCSLGSIQNLSRASLPNLQRQSQPQSRQSLASRSIKREIDDLKQWPLAEHSAIYPLSVRYQLAGDTAKAREVLALLEHAWKIEIDQLGFRKPIPYDPFHPLNISGPKRMNAYLQRGADTAVEGRSPVKDPQIWWDAYDSWISIDAWGKYAGKILASTVAHEFNHALHAAYDWYESPSFFETSATYIQEKVTPDDNDYLQQMEDFQQHPDWPVHYDDAYKTWYMYGASLYLFFLEQRYFTQDPQFLAKIWEGSRNRPRPLHPVDEVPDPATNEPDWVDSLENILPRGVSYKDTIVEFARWRWYTGHRSDSRHFHEGHMLTANGEVKIAKSLTAGQNHQSAGPLLGGSEYIQIKRPASGNVILKLNSPANVKWVLQAVPALQAGTDGEILNPQGILNFGNLTERTLIITALPVNQGLDPDLKSEQRLAFRLAIE